MQRCTPFFPLHLCSGFFGCFGNPYAIRLGKSDGGGACFRGRSARGAPPSRCRE